MVEITLEALQDALKHAEKAQCILSTLVDVDQVCAAEDSRGCADDLVQDIVSAIILINHNDEMYETTEWSIDPFYNATDAHHDKFGG